MRYKKWKVIHQYSICKLPTLLSTLPRSKSDIHYAGTGRTARQPSAIIAYSIRTKQELPTWVSDLETENISRSRPKKHCYARLSLLCLVYFPNLMKAQNEHGYTASSTANWKANAPIRTESESDLVWLKTNIEWYQSRYVTKMYRQIYPTLISEAGDKGPVR